MIHACKLRSLSLETKFKISLGYIGKFCSKGEKNQMYIKCRSEALKIRVSKVSFMNVSNKKNKGQF